MHRILERQVARSFGEHVTASPQWSAFLKLVSDTYEHFDEDRELLNRSLDLSSKEFLANNRKLEETRVKVELQAKNLAIEVHNRTKELNARVGELENVRLAMTNLLQDLEDERIKLAKEKIKVDVLVRDLEKFKLAVDNASDQIIITDENGIAIYANASVEKNTGFTLNDVLGKKAGELWRIAVTEEYNNTFWNTLKIQKKRFIGEIQNHKRNGEVYTAIINVTPVLDGYNNVRYYVVIERDITKEKEVDLAKTEFVAVASHALRTPLSAIGGIISMILDGEYGPVSANLTQPLADINISSDRLVHLVNDLLNISRIQTGKMKYQFSQFSMADVIGETAYMLAPLYDKRKLELRITNVSAVPVISDKEKVKEILTNLIGNAIKFTDQGTITVTTGVHDELMEIMVTDTGIGIAKDSQKKLFALFQQLDSGQGRPIGTGFGLHISRKIAQKMGGDLWLKESEVGKGSTFVFTVPLAGASTIDKLKDDLNKESNQYRIFPSGSPNI